MGNGIRLVIKDVFDDINKDKNLFFVLNLIYMIYNSVCDLVSVVGIVVDFK